MYSKQQQHSSFINGYCNHKKIISRVLLCFLTLFSVQAANASDDHALPHFSVSVGSAPIGASYPGSGLGLLGSGCTDFTLSPHASKELTVSTEDELPITLKVTPQDPGASTFSTYVNTKINTSPVTSFPGTCLVSSTDSCKIVFSWKANSLTGGTVLLLGCNANGCAKPIMLTISTT